MALADEFTVERTIQELEIATGGSDTEWELSHRSSADFYENFFYFMGDFVAKLPSLQTVKVPAVIFGDVHAQFDTFKTMIENEAFCFKKMQWKDIDIVFNGDLPDRGSQSLRVVFVAFAMKHVWPQRIHINRGNHELRKICKSYGLYDELKSDWPKDFDRLFDAICYAFDRLPVAATIGNKILCMHGGISNKLHSLSDIMNIKRPFTTVKDNTLECHLLWSDPKHIIELNEKWGFYHNGDRTIAVYFTEDALKECLEELDVVLCVRSHSATNGFGQFGNRQMIIVFSAPNYGETHNKASVLKVAEDYEITGSIYEVIEYEENSGYSKERETTVYSSDDDDDAVGGSTSQKKGKKRVIEEKVTPMATYTVVEKTAPKQGSAEKPTGKQATDEKDRPKAGKSVDEQTEVMKIEKLEFHLDSSVELQNDERVEEQDKTEKSELVTEPMASDQVLFEDETVEKKTSQETEDSRQKSNGNKPKFTINSMVPNLAVIVGLFCVFNQFSIANANPMSLTQFSERSSTLARFVNGLYLGQSLSSGTLDKRQLIDELFYLGPSVTLDSLSKSDFKKLITDLGTIQTTISTECTGDNGCGIPSSVTDKMNTIASFQKHVSDLEKALAASSGKEFEALNKLNKLVGNIKKLPGIAEEMVTQINDLVKTISTEQQNKITIKIANVGGNMDKITEMLTELETGASLIDAVTEEVVKNVGNKFSAIAPLQKIATEYQLQSENIVKLGQGLTTTTGNQEKVIKALDANGLNAINTNLDFLNSLRFLSNPNSNLIAGFPRGLDDMEMVMKDGENKWLMDLLSSGNDLNNISSKLSPLKNLKLELDPLNAAYKTAQQDTGFHPSGIKQLLSGKSDVISKLDKITVEFSSCIVNLKQADYNFDGTQQPGDIAYPTAEFEELKSTIQTFLNLKTSLDPVTTFSTSIMGNIQNKNALTATFNDAAVITSVTNTLKNLKKNVQAITTLKTGLWLNKIKVGSIDAAGTWIQETGLIGAMKCIQTTNSAKIPELNPVAKSLSSLNSQSPLVESMTKQVKSLENLVTEWNKIAATLPTVVRLKRSSPDFTYAKTAAKDLGDASSVIGKMSDSLKMKDDLMKLIEGSSTIDSAIEGITDSTKKDQLKKMWNQEAISALKENLETAKKVSEVVAKMDDVRNISDFKIPFELAAGVKESKIDFKDLADSLDGKVSDQNLATSLKSLGPIDLRFAGYEKSKIGKVLEELESYFDSIFAVKPEVLPQKDTDPCANKICPISTTTEEPDDTVKIILLCIGGAAFILVIVGIVACILKRDKLKSVYNRRFSKKPKGSGNSTETAATTSTDVENPKPPKKQKDKPIGVLNKTKQPDLEAGETPTGYILAADKKGKPNVIILDSLKDARRPVDAESKKPADNKIPKVPGKAKKHMSAKKSQKKRKIFFKPNVPIENPKLDVPGDLRKDTYEEIMNLKLGFKRLGMDERKIDAEIEFRVQNVINHALLNHIPAQPERCKKLPKWSTVASSKPLLKVRDDSKQPDVENIRRFQRSDHQMKNVYRRLGDEEVVSVEEMDGMKTCRSEKVPHTPNKPIDPSTKTSKPALPPADPSTRTTRTAEEPSRGPGGSDLDSENAVDPTSRNNDPKLVWKLLNKYPVDHPKFVILYGKNGYIAKKSPGNKPEVIQSKWPAVRGPDRYKYVGKGKTTEIDETSSESDASTEDVASKD
ncbi:hypothetical protein CRE_24746 [Caenorhabditis remanei]|uniref:Serine/threonine-protein phosphatase n=1 Tax=Caenorhabditis remanei TaxID=31234 RepID=E3N966_CAERE|nr:hypothetical protein CRE_24746 [Caenorhabditis remanei]